MTAAIVDTARGWIGTPYLHQASVRGVGCDCLGLVRGIWRELYGNEPEAIPPYTPDWSEPQQQEMLWIAANRHLEPRPPADIVPGRVILFRMRAGAVAKHLGIVSQGGPQFQFIHAYAGHGVVQSPLSAPWRRRVVACFAFYQG